MDAPELTPDLLADDAVVTERRFGSVFADAHACEFVEWGGCEVLGGTMPDSEWYRASWYDLVLTGVDLAGSRHQETGWRRLSLAECRLTGVDLGRAVVSDVTFSRCVLDLANFRFTKLTRVRFEDCRLRGADLGGAVLDSVVFDGCDLSEVDFHDVRSTRTSIERCRLEGIKSVTGLAGMRVDPADLLLFTAQLASAMGIHLVGVNAD